MTTRRPGAPRAPKTPGGIGAPVRRPGAPSGPSTDTAEGVGRYVTEVLTRLGDERDVLRTAMERIAGAEPSDSAARLRRVAQDALRESRKRS